MNPPDRSAHRFVLVLRILFLIFLLRALWAILAQYVDYFPANFDSDFLLLHEKEFSGIYPIAFYTHIVSSPVGLIAGGFLVADEFRRYRPKWHRWLGRFQIANVTLFVAPSGLVMAFYATGGWVSQTGFSVLSVGLFATASLGFHAAKHKNFGTHRQWMHRCFALLCSAPLLRFLTPFFDLIGIDPIVSYRLVAWLSWLIPIAIAEVAIVVSRRGLARGQIFSVDSNERH